ncbi:ribosome recycling factor [Texas Phoenix palm phytoplasma]|uniref:Ribosome recycling factor n=1 Tax=Texas Phoenix palm phytoplasma TaxID=176709 RepID=A0ABS5BIU4_9MOLU|nr:ribosome recycling factor [Texas Phoenix palm phytoplasma]MBP3059497.1 ribosome recycling factor [Texas Phoenix palm phytoplasma]
MELLAQEIINELEPKMIKANELMLKRFIDIRTGIANPKILDKITVQYYGEETLLRNISNITVTEGNQINIKPFDSNLISDIKKVILASKIGISPQDDGVKIKLIFPQPTEEKRKLLIKEVEKISEQTKISIRNIRRFGNDKIKKLKLNNQTESIFLKKIQELNNKWIKIIEKETLAKNNELLKI